MVQSTAIILKGYPRLSETFIAEELCALERHGLDFLIVSLRQPTDLAVHPVHGDIAATVLYLPEYLIREPGRVFAAWYRSWWSGGCFGSLFDSEWVRALY